MDAREALGMGELPTEASELEIGRGGERRPVMVEIEVCSSAGYSKMADFVEECVREQLGKVEVQRRVVESSGLLEVWVGGKLVHSKAKGDGFVYPSNKELFVAKLPRNSLN